MLNEKPLDKWTNDELSTGITEFFRQSQPPAPQPLPPGITPEMSEKTKETASQLYAEAILRKSAGAWTQAERDFIQAGTRSALRELGF